MTQPDKTTTLEGLADEITDLKLRLSHIETYLQYPDGPPPTDEG